MSTAHVTSRWFVQKLLLLSKSKNRPKGYGGILALRLHTCVFLHLTGSDGQACGYTAEGIRQLDFIRPKDVG